MSLDIETTGLDPLSSRVVAVGIAQNGKAASLLEEDELLLLKELNRLMEQQSEETLLVSWNGEEFDFPYLRARFDEGRVHSSLELSDSSKGVGKYGRPTFAVRWGSVRHVDIAPLYRKLASKKGVAWSLKPVAKAVLKRQPVEVDRSGQAIAAMNLDDLRAYVESDALITLQLAERLGTSLTRQSIPAIGESPGRRNLL